MSTETQINANRSKRQKVHRSKDPEGKEKSPKRRHPRPDRPAPVLAMKTRRYTLSATTSSAIMPPSASSEETLAQRPPTPSGVSKEPGLRNRSFNTLIESAQIENLSPRDEKIPSRPGPCSTISAKTHCLEKIQRYE